MAVTERTLSFDHMWSASHLPAVKHSSSQTRLPKAMQQAGFEIKTVGETPLVFDRHGRPFAEAGVFCGPLASEAAHVVSASESYAPHRSEFAIDRSLVPSTERQRVAAYQSKMRLTATAEFEAAFMRQFAYLKKANFDHNLANTLHVYQHPEVKNLLEGLDFAGGAWVPPTFLSEVMSAVSEQSLMGLATIRPTSSDTLWIPTFLPNASSAYSSQMPITGGAGETPARPSPTLSGGLGFGLLEIPIKRFRTPPIPVSRDLLADAAFLLPYLRDRFVADLGTLISQWMLYGDGGILTNAQIPSSNLQGALGHALDNSSDDRWRQSVKAALPEQYRAKAVALMHGSLQAAYENETPGSSNRPIAVRHNDVAGDRF